jgi:hypothetical protein
MKSVQFHIPEAAATDTQRASCPGIRIKNTHLRWA